ncbi:MAG: synthase - Glutamine amidotransferase domain protein [Actinomycetia bacterium]|nr:synthase - Glutamine amidotransferase domain protein [Actinomycetes bacterium]
MPEILILQHADWELPGTFGDVLAERGIPHRVVRPDLGEPLPEVRDIAGIAGIVAMGGPMSVNDDAVLPWLTGEKAFVRAAVTAGAPYLGTCLGAQLLAAALGAPVYRDGPPEYGMHPVAVDANDDPVLGGLPRSVEVFQWHGETFGLPAGAVRLASSPEYENQAYRIGRWAYGLQFHLEVTPELLATWLTVPQCLTEIQAHLGADAGQQLTKEHTAAAADQNRLARQVFTRWLTAVDTER